MLTGEKRVHNAKTDKMVSPAVLYGYLYSGDRELWDKAVSAFRHSEGIASHDGKDLGQSYCFGIRIPALIERGLELIARSEAGDAANQAAAREQTI